MTRHLDRREFIQLAGLTTAGIAGVVFSSGLRGVSLAAAKHLILATIVPDASWTHLSGTRRCIRR